MAENKHYGRKLFLQMISDMIKDSQKRGISSTIELGTYTTDGVIPDSYPAEEEPDSDFYSLFMTGIKEGDRILILWTDDGDIVAIGPLEGGDDNG